MTSLVMLQVDLKVKSFPVKDDGGESQRIPKKPTGGPEDARKHFV